MANAPQTDECQRMAKVAPDSQKIGEFLDWLSNQGLAICSLTYDDDYDTRVWVPEGVPIEQRLAKYFDIDLNKVEDERRALLEYIRSNT